LSTKLSEGEVRDLFSDILSDDGGYELHVDHMGDEDEKVPFFLLKHPWGDSTMALAVPEEKAESKKLIEVLQRIELPDSFSGIFHKDMKKLEIFWTAFKLRDKHKEVAERSFKIWWRNRQRECWFGPPSEDALLIAKYTVPFAAPSHTDHRNVLSFSYFVHDMDLQNLEKPVCFWIDCSNIADCDLEEYLRTVNFYMTYYDRETPRILIHEQGLKRTKNNKPRYAEDKFPIEFVAGDIDPSVISFWLGAFETRDPAMKYLLHFRLIEFLANSHINDSQQKELISILRRPHLISSADTAAAEIAGLFALKSKGTDRIKEFVKEAVGPEKVWAVLEMNKHDFCVNSEFDGGYKVGAIISDSTTLDAWRQSGAISLVDRLRAIRNCLAHGQDEGTKGIIYNTQNNRRVLMPWVNLIETFAAEAMLYSRRTYVSGESNMSTTE